MPKQLSWNASIDLPALHRWVAHLLGMDLEQRQDIYAGVAASATLRDGAYWLEILFSAGIATLGLILNSPAVIIGAMLISPLMGPILANGLALAAGDLVLSIRALVSLLLSAFVAVSFATILVVLLPFREMTAEIAARTRPNTLDLVIALFSGAVGSIATCKNVRGVATSIPGVAIAVALMPPLCVVGYGVGLIFMTDRVQGEAVVRGGGLLFLTNLVAITFMAMIVFLIFRIEGSEVRKRGVREGDTSVRMVRLPIPKALARVGSLPGRLILIILFIGLLTVPLSRSLDSLKHEIAERQFENRLQKRATQLWQEKFARTPAGDVRSYIDTFSATDHDGRLALHLRIFTSHAYSYEERAAFLHQLAHLLRRSPESIDLSLVEIPTSSYAVAARARPEMITPAPAPLATPVVIADLRGRIAQAIAEVPLPSPAALDTYALTLTPQSDLLEIGYVSTREIDPDGKSILSGRFREVVNDDALDLVLHRVLNAVDVSFRRRGTSIDERTLAELKDLQPVAVRHPSWPVIIEVPVNDPTRDRRLASIRAQLIAQGVNGSRIASTDVAGGGYRVTVAPAPQPAAAK